ncbi:homoserine O-acetyltransferase [Xylanimonas cellulosilytica DSM 15894]|uniref:Homoserine O-acetyltransferase n=1 Tax=Xylanimonas cellulosilytica (strain DSM 15894 / JCM 12276 / CECT 5975 / KCTC 9989 / LMG 20990 / NBRC 107835 / XIL07) TaxID=446471 RepID=D1BZB1_XYLCX|nr:homoserine O-acetyltransferase [Xylanimonas cellulosilytica]ACZ32008.1 homoserine O-acetyltransferase [Xylanimonas cellulosilytica DSM 15894]
MTDPQRPGQDARARVRPPVPASGAWRPGDDPGRRQFAALGGLELEGGWLLPEVTLAYETYGTLDADGGNAVLILHGLTGDSHVAGPAGPGHVTGGWWTDMVGPGLPLDTDRYFVVVPNVLGGCQGSTGPASTAPDGRPWGARFPRLTTRDQVAAEVLLARQLGITGWELVAGPSLGGLRALEWAVLGPEAGIEVRGLIAIGTAAQASADQIAWSHPQLAAIRLDPGWRDGDYYDAPDGQGPHAGLAIARQIAHTTYRTAGELETRFGRLPQGGEDPFTDGRYAVQSYLDHHGDKLARRFDANSYLVLTESMNTHDLGRDRGGVDAALASITARTLVVAIDSDRLFPVELSARIAAGIPEAHDLRVLRSPHGHDGFLIEFDQLGPMVRDFLEVERVRAPR